MKKKVSDVESLLGQLHLIWGEAERANWIQIILHPESFSSEIVAYAKSSLERGYADEIEYAKKEAA